MKYDISGPDNNTTHKNIKHTSFVGSFLVDKEVGGFCGHLLSEDDHSHWAPPYWNVTKETFSLGRTEV